MAKYRDIWFLRGFYLALLLQICKIFLIYLVSITTTLSRTTVLIERLRIDQPEKPGSQTLIR